MVSFIVKHPAYKLVPIQNDIAILYLEEKVEYQPHIQPICLPQATDSFDGQRCIANGWGTVQGTYATIMKKISLPVVPRARCERMLQFAGLGPFYRLPQGFMCAGGEANVDTCKGDGGSPLACKHANGSFVLAGIVSWGIGCGGQDRPGVYVSVSNYVSWINEQMDRMTMLLRIEECFNEVQSTKA
ncbi:inactive CLIP domain-containing serine protease A28-like [Anopheles coustani]|uniref:inactive CLIP domain-containing serine protease A28-like n=1 Tax=Anopheles coustani TaxID=139045 RepID=UPI00265908C9|nr:inactive CLIP domain-containing serine protease A28-like [Anopheles coustani]